MSTNASVPSPLLPASDPAFEQRWSEWLARGREHARVGRRRLVVAVVCAAVGAAGVGYFFYFHA